MQHFKSYFCTFESRHSKSRQSSYNECIITVTLLMVTRVTVPMFPNCDLIPNHVMTFK